MKIKKPETLLKKWIEALESGDYKQVQGHLYSESEGEPRYCCLGVLCDVSNQFKFVEPIDLANRLDHDKVSEWDGELELLPNFLAQALDITHDGEFVAPVKHRGKEYHSLTQLNDGGVRFKAIARIIRREWDAKNFYSFVGRRKDGQD